jgi:hypothetical protein
MGSLRARSLPRRTQPSSPFLDEIHVAMARGEQHLFRTGLVRANAPLDAALGENTERTTRKLRIVRPSRTTQTQRAIFKR